MADSTAASEDLKREPVDQQQDLPPLQASKSKYKSWRRKYRKMRSRFDDGMEETNNLFLSTNHLQEVAQRLQEQNDQLLEILMDINCSKEVPTRFQYDLEIEEEPQQQASPQSTYSKQEVVGGDIKLKHLEEGVPHTTYESPLEKYQLPAEFWGDETGQAPDGYLTPKHEEEYLTVIDNALDVIPLPSPSRPNTIIDPSVDLRPRNTSPPTERDFATQNPISVHNWLLRNKPQIKMEHDGYSERGEVGTGSGGNKKKGGRREKTKEDAPFEGLDDEIGFDAASEEHFGKSKRKSKGDGDHTYRPKGGRSRPAKRKRDKGDDGDFEIKESKKAKGASAAEAEVGEG